MTSKTRRLLQVLGLSSGVGLLAVAAMISLTWPANTLGNFLHARQSRAANVRALEMRVSVEPDPLQRAFYQAWLAEEKGDLGEAIRGFGAVRDETRPGTLLHLHSSLRLGLAYGKNGEADRELATYQALMGQYPGASRLSQATFHLRRREMDRARTLLDTALAQDARDGSLGGHRQMAQQLRDGLGLGPGAGPSTPH